MEDALVQSAMAEIAMWDAFAAGRTANATGFLAIVLAVWVAARFSSVSLEKNVNNFSKSKGLMRLAHSKLQEWQETAHTNSYIPDTTSKCSKCYFQCRNENPN